MPLVKRLETARLLNQNRSAVKSKMLGRSFRGRRRVEAMPGMWYDQSDEKLRWFLSHRKKSKRAG
jgi:hypothetical protein